MLPVLTTALRDGEMRAESPPKPAEKHVPKLHRISAALLALALFTGAGCAAEPDGLDGDLAPIATNPDDARVADNVELKATVPDADVTRVLARLGLDASDAEQRDVYFYDTRALDLFAHGIVLRARKVHDGADDSTIKFRPLARTDVDRAWFDESGFKCETDIAGTTAVDSCSLTVPQDRGEIDDVAAGRRRVDQLFSSAQEDFARTFASAPIAWSSLRALGPIDERVWQRESRSLRAPLTVERWTLPDGHVLLELSIRVPRSGLEPARVRFDAYLHSLAIDTSVRQETKTRVALEYFASQH